MANYNNLISSIQSVIKQNGSNAITGQILQNALLSMIQSLGDGYQYKGIATPSTNPGTPDSKVFYLASTPGEYVNFNSLTLESGRLGILTFDSTWHLSVIVISSDFFGEISGNGSFIAYGNTSYSKTKAGNILRVYIVTQDTKLSGNGQAQVFNIIYQKTDDISLITAMSADAVYPLLPYYDVVVPANGVEIKPFMRAAAGQTLQYFYQDVSDSKVVLGVREENYNTSAGTILPYFKGRILTDVFRVNPKLGITFVNYSLPDGVTINRFACYKDGVFVRSIAPTNVRGFSSIPCAGDYNQMRVQLTATVTINAALLEQIKIYVDTTAIINKEEEAMFDFDVPISFDFGQIGTSGGPIGAITENKGLSRWSRYMELNIDEKAYLSEEIPSGCELYQYDENLTFINAITSRDSINKRTRYVRIVRTGLTPELGSVKVHARKFPKLLDSGRYTDTYPRYVSLSYKLNIPPVGNTISSDTYTGKRNSNDVWNNGYIMLPENYSVQGTPVKLIIFCHGTNGYLFSQQSVQTYDSYVRFLCANGYAVADCSVMSSANPGSSVRDINAPNALALACYTGLYRYIVEHYNVEREVYIFGKSAGGMNSVLLSNFKPFPIKACAGLAPSLDFFENMRIIGPQADINYSFKELGIDKTYNSYNPMLNLSDSDIEELVSFGPQMAGYNPMLVNTVGLDVEKFYKWFLKLSFSDFTQEKNIATYIGNAGKVQPFPYKIWHAVDDVNVPILSSYIYQALVQNAGGLCIVRELPAGTGAHHAVDNDANALKTNYLCKNGQTINIATAYAEMVDWFNQW